MGYVPNPTVDGWLAERRPSLLYRSGEEIREGDSVDFGLDPSSIGIDLAEGPWPGTVVGINVAAGRVVVDTFCNSVETYTPEELKLLGRWPEDRPRYSAAATASAAGKWYVTDDISFQRVKACLSQAEAEAERDRMNGAARSSR